MLMKNFTLAVLTASFIATGAFAQTSADKNILPVKTKALFEKFAKNMHAVKSTSATVKTLRAKRANENAIWKPQHDIQYSYDEGGWSKEAENNYTYNAQGLVLTQLQNAGDYAKVENTYNAKGQITNQVTWISEDGETYEKASERVQDYDDATSYTTKYESKISDGKGGTITGRGSYYIVIDRNKDGNITKLSSFAFDGDEYTESQRMVIAYDNGGNAPTSVTCYELDVDDNNNPTFVPTQQYTNMVWTKSDGQLTGVDPLDLVSKTNQLKSCTFTSEEDGTMNYDVVDVKDNGSFTINATMEGYTAKEALIEFKNEITDDNGSYRYGGYLHQMGQLVLGYYEEEKFDDHGNSTLHEYWATPEDDLAADANTNEGYVLEDGIKHDYKYEGPHGEMTEDIESDYDTDKSAYLPNIKVNYDSFVDVAATTAIKGVKNNAYEPATFYNLQGMKVNGNAKGLYIMKQGSKTVKIMK